MAEKSKVQQKEKYKAESKESKTPVTFTDKDQLIAVIRLRGTARVPGIIADTLQMLNLHLKNYCSVYKDTPSIRGMLMKVKDYVTYGTIDYAMYKELVSKHGEQDVRKGGMKKFFRLNPPRKGFGRRGIKVSFAQSGALGDRKDKMADLIKRMLK